MFWRTKRKIDNSSCWLQNHVNLRHWNDWDFILGHSVSWQANFPVVCCLQWNRICPEGMSQSIPSLMFSVAQFFAPLEVKFHIFGSSEHRKKSTSKLFLPSLQSVSQQTVSSIKPMKKICHINFKDNPKRWATAKSPSKNMHTLNLNVILQFQIFSQSKTLNCLQKRSWLCSTADMTIHNLPYEFGYKHPTIHLSQFHPAEG